MSKILKTAAMVVGAVALVATGIGSLGIGAALGMSQTTLATIASVAHFATLGASALSVAAALTAKKPTAQSVGSPVQFTADPDAAIPLVVGRIASIGRVLFKERESDDSRYHDRRPHGGASDYGRQLLRYLGHRARVPV